MTGIERNSIHHADIFDLCAGLDAGSVDMIFTDPPYGVCRPSQWTPTPFAEIANNDRPNTGWLNEAFRVLRDDSACYVCCHWRTASQFTDAAEQAGFSIRSMIVWDKVIHGLADIETCYAPSYELVMFAAKGRHVFNGPRPKDILRVKRVHSLSLIHPYEKPVKLVEYFIRISTARGGIVLDPFAGSGTTAVAARQMRRDYIVGDSSAEYVELMRDRLGKPYTLPMLAFETEAQSTG